MAAKNALNQRAESTRFGSVENVDPTSMSSNKKNVEAPVVSSNAYKEEHTIPEYKSLFFEAINSTGKLIWFVNTSFIYTAWNEAFALAYKRSVGVEIVNGIDARIHLPFREDLTKDFSELYREAYNGNQHASRRITFESSGVDRTAEVEVIPMRENGKVKGLMVTVSDLTRQITAARRTRDNDRLVRTALNSVDWGLFIIDPNYRLVYYNKKFEDTFESFHLKRPTYYQSLIDQISDKDLLTVLRGGLEGLKSGRSSGFFCEFKRKNNMPAKFKLEPTYDGSSFLGITGKQVSQLTQKNPLQGKATQTQKSKLKLISEELDSFVYSASHDLRAPLMSIKGLVNILRVDPERANLEIYMDYIISSINKLDNYIREMVNYSKNKKLVRRTEAINFTDIINECLEQLKYLDGMKEFFIATKVEDHYPFFSDATRLTLIISNLISNANLYRDRSKSSYLKILVSVGPKRAEIQFHDNGIGIAPQHLGKIFDMFYRAHAQSKGSGLGLYNVKKCVAKLNGSIKVSSEIGVGTSFKIILPNLKPWFRVHPADEQNE